MKKIIIITVLFLTLAPSLFAKTEFGVITGMFIVPNMANDKVDPDHYQEINLAGGQVFLKESRNFSSDINGLVKIGIGEGAVKMSTLELGLEIVHNLPWKKEVGEEPAFIGLEISGGAHHLNIDLPESYKFEGTGAICSAQIFFESQFPVPLVGIKSLKLYIGTSALPQGSVGRFRPGSKPGLAVDAGGKLTASELFKLGASIVF